jgi:putative tricarboxylic transport membrane protein
MARRLVPAAPPFSQEADNVKKDVAVGTVLMALSITFFVATWSFPITGQYVSPRVFPRFVSACMLILSAILVFNSLKAPPPAKDDETEADGMTAVQKAKTFISDNRLFILFALFAFAYTRLIDYLGFILSTPVLLAGTVFAFKEKRWYVIASVSIVGTSVFYYVFRIIFKVPLPRFDLF